MDEILLNEPKTVGAVNHEAPDILESDYDENNLHQVVNMSLDDTEEKVEWNKPALEYKSSYVIENRNKMIYIHDNRLKNISE